MNDNLRKLLAGYATGTLTDAERRALFDAALTDEELFAAISEEEPLRELLADPAARAELLSRIEPAPVAFRERFAAWLRRPPVLAGFATAAVAIVIISVIPLWQTPQQQRVAMLEAPYAEPQMTTAVGMQSPTGRQKTAAAVPAPAARATPKRRQPQPSPAPITEKSEAPAAVQPPAATGDAVAFRAPGEAQLVVAPPDLASSSAVSDQSTESRAGMARLVRSAKASEVAQGMRISVLRRGESGSYSDVDPSTSVFAQGDTVRIRVAPAEDGVIRIQGATPQPIVQTLAKGGSFETGDILVGAQDMHLLITFGAPLPAARTFAAPLRTSEALEPKVIQPVVITLSVKKP